MAVQCKLSLSSAMFSNTKLVY